MFKSSRFLDELGYQASHALTPIRDYDNDYFHKDDYKLPTIQRPPDGRPKENAESKSGSTRSSKRPASLVLDDQKELSNKKQYSPLDLRKFLDVTKLDEGGNEKSSESTQEFLGVLRELVDSETEYVRTMETSISVFRKTLREHKTFKNKLIQKDSHDELLLFGNIETISSISRLFLSSLTDGLSPNTSVETIEEEYWTGLNSNEDRSRCILHGLDIGKAFNLHFLRIRSTYLSYSVTHQKQNELLELLRSGNPHLFQKWYDCCMKLAGMKKLEDIFERPIKRLGEWTELLSRLLASSQDLLDENLISNLSNALNQYASFVRDVANETKEFNNNAVYDFSLTPSEIIQSYEIEWKNENNSFSKPERNVLSASSSGRDTDNVSLSVKTMKRGTRDAVNSVFSGSSSRYSGDSTIVPIQEVKTIHSSPGPQLMSENIDDLTLAEHVTKLKRVHRGLIELKNIIGKEDMLTIFDMNLKYAKLWASVMNCEASLHPMEDIEEVQRPKIPLYYSYILRLERQREEAILMKVEEMEKLVKVPLSSVIQLCEFVRSHLRDLNALKKDYLSYLRERKTSIHDVKREILSKHFEQMQAKMLHQLPSFIKLTHRVIEFIILNYHKTMLRYLEIAAGGEKSVIEDLEFLGGLKRDVGKNLDILEGYSSSRYRSKRMVRDEWEFDQDPASSRVLRKLFEL